MDLHARLSWPLARSAAALKSAVILVLASPGLALSPLASSPQASAKTPADPLLAFLEAHPAEKSQAIDCLGDAIYYEAGFEPLEGQQAVAQVVLNRVRDPRYPDTVCGVVFDGWEKRTGCQFSFVCDGSYKRRPPSYGQTAAARAVAKKALAGAQIEELTTATHYHTDYVDPYWAPKLEEVTTIGRHIFYIEPDPIAETRKRTQGAYRGGEIALRSTIKVQGA
jgi:spore germination cell wall hydrolase CwlJ-like protein